MFARRFKISAAGPLNCMAATAHLRLARWLPRGGQPGDALGPVMCIISEKCQKIGGLLHSLAYASPSQSMQHSLTRKRGVLLSIGPCTSGPGTSGPGTSGPCTSGPGTFMGAAVATLVLACLVTTGVAQADLTKPDAFYNFDWSELESLQFSRADISVDEAPAEIQTELSFKLSPGKFEFSRAGAFGLTGVFSNPELALQSLPTNALDARTSVPRLHNGLSYSAGIKIEHDHENISGTAYVSSGQLGISYGRLGRVWYNGLDVRLGQFASTHPQLGSSEVLSFDLTAGRRMGWTGVGRGDPLWLLSLEGNFDMQSENGDNVTDDDGDWFLNPSLFWQNPEFTFSAQLQVPVDRALQNDIEEPSYKLRAIFEKHFR